MRTRSRTAVTSRLLETGTGQQFLSATLGQTYYFQPPKVQIPLEPTTGLRSDMVAEVALTAYKNWSVNLGEQWDPDTSKSDRTIVELQFKPATDAVVNLAYRFQRDTPAEQQAQAQAVSVAYGEFYASRDRPGAYPARRPSCGRRPWPRPIRLPTASTRSRPPPPGRSCATGMPTPGWSTPWTSTRCWSASPASSTTAAAGACGSWRAGR